MSLYQNAYERGRNEVKEEIIKIIKEMQETAESQMWFKESSVCETIINVIEKEVN